MCRITEIRSLSEFKEFRNQWDVCLNNCEGKSVFLTHEWFLNFIQNINEIDELCVLCDGVNQETKAIFPGINKTEIMHRVRFRSIGFISNYYSPHCSFINFKNHHSLANIFQYIDKKKWDIMLLNDIREHTHEYEIYCEKLKESGIPYDLYKQDANWFLPCRDLNFNDYLKIKGKKKEKKWLYEKRRMEKMNGFSFEMQLVFDNNLERSINDYYEVYDNSWKINEPYPDFHKSLIKVAAKNGWLRLGTIRLGTIPIASQIWLVFNKTASILKVAYHEKYKKYSPGTVLNLLMIQHVLDMDKVHEIDFLKGNDAYKKDWMTDCRKLNTLIIYNKKSVKGKMLYAFDRYIYPTAQKFLHTFGKPGSEQN